jgi:hypothetical protein
LEEAVVNSKGQIRNSLAALAASIVLPAGAMQVITVSIDLRPDDPPPTLVAPRAQGMLPVGILTTDSFDATTIATATLRLGPTGKEAPPVRVNRADVDRDGDTDLQVFFAVQELGVTCRDKRLVLRGQTTAGQEIEGSEAIVTDGC